MNKPHSYKLSGIIAAGLLALALVSAPASAHSDNHIVGPIAAFIALNALFHHKHHRRHYRHHRHHHYKHHRRHSHSHGGYQGHKRHRH